jgi:hypothetical protein
MPVYVFTGGLGSGKTLSMSVQANIFHRLTNLPVYANYGLKDSSRLVDLDHLFSLENGIIAFDEFQVVVDSRNFKGERQKAVTQWGLQSRKAGLVVFATTQDVTLLDIRLRKIVDVVFDCRKLGYPGSWRSYLAIYDRVAAEQWARRGARVLIHAQWMYDLYDTYERVRLMD